MQADYVIIGAGSAGCAMAYRLSEAGRSVIVIEHGGSDIGPFIQMPGALSYPMNMPRYDWGYSSEPEPHLNNRRLVTPRGKVIGGSSSINGMVYVRGHAGDFDHWAEQGADGWSYADVLPYYKRMENWRSGGRGGDKSWRGRKGPLHVSRGPGGNPLTQAFIEAGQQAGYQMTPDYNGQQQEGVGPFDATIKHGRRWSAANAYLRPAELYIQMAASKPVSLYKYWNIPMKGFVGTQWLLAKLGLGASNQFESGGFIRSKAGVRYPDIQFHFLPIAVRYDGQAAAEGHGYQAHVGPMRSKSRGHVTLASNDPDDAPKIAFNYMSHADDWQDFRTCIRLTREIFGQAAFAPYAKHEIQPGEAVQTDAQLDAFIAEHAESAYHPCGTARMGRADDPMAVVDPEARVIGTQNLRLADSSIFPRITNGNLNAPSIMVGEKAADHILGKAPLPKDNAQPWIHPNWQTEQR